MAGGQQGGRPPQGNFNPNAPRRFNVTTDTSALRFMMNEGVGAILMLARGGDGTLFTDNGVSRAKGYPNGVPMVHVGYESYGRIWRMAQKGQPVTLELDMQNRFLPADTSSFNVIAEIPGTDPALKPEDVAAAVADALGARPALTGEAAEGGLFALGRRRFGQDAHLSQAVAAAQRTTGVVWVEPVAFALLPPTSDDPADLTLPAKLPLLMRLRVSPREVLALSALHLTLNALAAVADEECPT